MNSHMLLRMFISAGWESLLIFVRNSISNGSKEVVLAAINCLQTTVLSHCPKVIYYIVLV